MLHQCPASPGFNGVDPRQGFFSPGRKGEMADVFAENPTGNNGKIIGKYGKSAVNGGFMRIKSIIIFGILQCLLYRRVG